MADLTMTQPAMPEGVEPYDDEQLGEGHEKDDPKEKLEKDIAKHFKQQVEKAERDKREYIFQWKRNIELRQGQPYGATSTLLQDADDEYQSEYNPDWFLTKTKTAALFSQVPIVRLVHQNAQFQPATGPFAKSINYELSDNRCNTGAAMFEVMNDVVNASGIGGIEVGYSARFIEKDVPSPDVKLLPPMQVMAMMMAGTLPMVTVPSVSDYRFFTERISPADLLTPSGFTSSDWDAAPWLGRKFRSSWAEIKVEFELDDDVKESLTSDDNPNSDENLRTGKESASASTELKAVRGKRVYYWRHRVDPDCKYFSEIWEIVWLDGKEDEPIVHRPWKGQKFDEKEHRYIGACKLPIRVCTKDYISDNPIPPSDSQAGRPQVNDLRRSRSQMFQNRAYSMPLRWFNTDKTDPMMHSLLMRGRVQGMIPVQGDGTKMIGEVARASYPSEDLTFDKMSLSDLMMMWMVGPNQMGQFASHEVTKGESENAAGGFSSVIGQERMQVLKFFLGTVEVLAGLMALYSEFQNLSQQERMAMQNSWDGKRVLHELAFEILPDSQIVQDTNTRIKKIASYINLTAKSGYVNIKPAIVLLTELHGLDPNEYVVDPKPHPMKPMSITLSIKGMEDLDNPLMVALLARNQQLPSPEEIEMGRDILLALQQQLPMEKVKDAAQGRMMLAKQKQQMAKQGGPGGPKPGQAGPRPVPRAPGAPGQDMMPQWSLANKIAKRSRDMGGGA